MPSAGPEATEGAWAVLAGVLSFGGLAAGYFVRGFLKSFLNPEPRTEEKRVVLESADIADMGGLRGVGAKLAEIHPAVLATNQGVAEALVILRGQEHRAAVMAEAKKIADERDAARLREEDRQRDDDRRRQDDRDAREDRRRP